MPREQPEEQVRFIGSNALPGAELLVCPYSTKHWHIFHERYAICGVRIGSAGWRYRSREHHMGDGSIMLLEPGEVHRNTQVHKPGDFKVMMVSSELFNDAARDLGVPVTTHFRRAQVEDPELFRLIYGFCESVETGETVLAQQSWFSACVRRLLDYAEQRPPTPRLIDGHRSVERAKAYLQDRFNQSVNLDELAAVSGLSRFHLVRSFTKRVGLPPHAYQIHIRIERATAMLRSGIPPIEVAARTGFADQSHLTRHFKNILRTTPARYARG